MVSICDQIVHDGTPWETCDALRIRYAPQKKPLLNGVVFLWFNSGFDPLTRKHCHWHVGDGDERQPSGLFSEGESESEVG